MNTTGRQALGQSSKIPSTTAIRTTFQAGFLAFITRLVVGAGRFSVATGRPHDTDGERGRGIGRLVPVPGGCRPQPVNPWARGDPLAVHRQHDLRPLTYSLPIINVVRNVALD